MKRLTTDTTEIISDGRTVWVNATVCLGRFGPQGVDVHQDAEGQRTGKLCLDCHPDPDWDRFKASMLKFHGIAVGDEFRPEWCLPNTD